MNSKTVAIIGSSGYVGRTISEYLSNINGYNVIEYNRKSFESKRKVDLDDLENVDWNSFEQTEYALFLAAISSPDRCEKENEYAWRINVENTKIAIEELLKRNVKVIFFSSDAIFEGGNEQFDEMSQTNPASKYGIMKKAIEDAFIDKEYFKTVRLSYVLSKKDKFTKYCLECMEKKLVAEIFHPFERNCIMAQEVNEAVCWLMGNWGKFNSESLNIAGEKLISRVDIAQEIKKMYGEKFVFKVIMPPEEFFVDRQKKINMKSKYLYEKKIIKKASFEERYRKELQEG